MPRFGVTIDEDNPYQYKQNTACTKSNVIESNGICIHSAGSSKKWVWLVGDKSESTSRHLYIINARSQQLADNMGISIHIYTYNVGERADQNRFLSSCISL